MYQVLESMINKNNIDKEKMAETLHMEYEVLLSKISGEQEITLDEALCIQRYIGEEIPVEILFQKNKKI